MAIGGGYETAGMFSIASRPGATGTGWNVSFCYDSSSTLMTEIDYWVVCAHR